MVIMKTLQTLLKLITGLLGAIQLCKAIEPIRSLLPPQGRSKSRTRNRV